jgi:hypothetical protein
MREMKTGRNIGRKIKVMKMKKERKKVKEERREGGRYN